MIDKAALEYLVNIGRFDSRFQKAPDYDITGAYIAQTNDGTWEQCLATKAPPSSHLYTVADLVARVAEDLKGTRDAAIYYSPERVIAKLTDADDVRWQHRLELELHPAFVELERLQATRAFSQRDLVRFLRARLNGHVPPATVERFRALRLTTDGEANSVMTQGRQAVDRKIVQQVTEQGGNEIPEKIEATVPVYDLDEEREHLEPVELLVEPVAEDGHATFEITAVLNSLRAARAAALERIAAAIDSELGDHEITGVPVFYGQPHD